MGYAKSLPLSILIKGNECEDMCLSFVMEQVDKGFLFKNEEHFTNDWLTGTPDVVTDQVLIDVKNSFTGSTFPWFETECPNKEYFYQLQGYMFLTISKRPCYATA
jgi:hypothetical protein